MNNPLAHLGYDPARFSSALAKPEPNCQVARVVEQHRSGYLLSHAGGSARAHAHPKLRQLSAAERPAVGDFVWWRQSEELVAALLPRYSALQRAAAGERYAGQTLAANIDKVLILCGLDRDYSPRRIERYLTLVHGCGIAAAVVLSKADKFADAVEVLAELRNRLGSKVPVYSLDTRAPEAIEMVRAELAPGTSGVLLGSSGAGKSTLSNNLLGNEQMRTGHVRSSDGRGRHTTVHRALLSLPWGACLIDSPGLREIKLTGEEEVEAQTFGDIGELAADCKFRDCQHDREPGCAVQAAIEEGRLSEDRFVSYCKLSAERDLAAAKSSARAAKQLRR